MKKLSNPRYSQITHILDSLEKIWINNPKLSFHDLLASGSIDLSGKKTDQDFEDQLNQLIDNYTQHGF